MIHSPTIERFTTILLCKLLCVSYHFFQLVGRSPFQITNSLSFVVNSGYIISYIAVVTILSASIPLSTVVTWSICYFFHLALSHPATILFTSTSLQLLPAKPIFRWVQQSSAAFYLLYLELLQSSLIYIHVRFKVPLNIGLIQFYSQPIYRWVLQSSAVIWTLSLNSR